MVGKIWDRVPSIVILEPIATEFSGFDTPLCSRRCALAAFFFSYSCSVLADSPQIGFFFIEVLSFGVTVETSKLSSLLGIFISIARDSNDSLISAFFCKESSSSEIRRTLLFRTVYNTTPVIIKVKTMSCLGIRHFREQRDTISFHVLWITFHCEFWLSSSMDKGYNEKLNGTKMEFDGLCKLHIVWKIE